MPKPKLLYEFRYRCPLRKRWVKAGYRAELHEIKARYAEWQTIGEPEERYPYELGEYFDPFRKPRER